MQTSYLSSPLRWLKFEEDVEDGGERWSKPYVATLSLHSLFELRSCIINGSVLLDMHADCIEEIAGETYINISVSVSRGKSKLNVCKKSVYIIGASDWFRFFKQICYFTIYFPVFLFPALLNHFWPMSLSKYYLH